jgi:hypothetical protein
MASIMKRDNGKWRARYRDSAGKEHARHFARKVDAQQWLDAQTAKLVAGTHVTPRQARTTVGEWCDTWLDGYRGKRATTVRQAEVHILRIRAEFGAQRLGDVRPSQVRTWCAKLKAEGLADSYVYAPARPSLAALRRCRPRRACCEVSVLAAHLAEGGQAARLRGLHGAGLGPPRRDAQAPARGRAPRRLLRSPAGRGVRSPRL